MYNRVKCYENRYGEIEKCNDLHEVERLANCVDDFVLYVWKHSKINGDLSSYHYQVVEKLYTAVKNLNDTNGEYSIRYMKFNDVMSLIHSLCEDLGMYDDKAIIKAMKLVESFSTDKKTFEEYIYQCTTWSDMLMNRSVENE